MKLKIISGNNYGVIEKEVNEFMEGKEIVKVSVTETYDIGHNSGFVTYHIFYK